MTTRTFTVVCSRCATELPGTQSGVGFRVKRHKRPDGTWCVGHLVNTHWLKEEA